MFWFSIGNILQDFKDPASACTCDLHVELKKLCLILSKEVEILWQNSFSFRVLLMEEKYKCWRLDYVFFIISNVVV